ncbi:MAG: glycosyltransferase family A protein [Candidatus Bipolaricaulota bacterium]
MKQRPLPASPLVSVVVPARNEANLLPSCLDALREQSYARYEVVVVDNGSADDTGLVAERYGCCLVREQSPGVATARQRGFVSARGDIIASTDADSTVPPDWLERIVRRFEENPARVGVYGTLLFPEEGPLLLKVAGPMLALFLWANHRLARPHFCGPNFAVRRDAFFKCGGFMANGKAYGSSEDVQLSLKLRHLGVVLFDPGIRVHTSPRRLKQGGVGYVWRNVCNYSRVVWLGRCC